MAATCDRTTAVRAQLASVIDQLTLAAPDRILDIVSDLESAVAKAQALVALSTASEDLRHQMSAVRRDLHLTNALFNHAVEFYAGWARIVASSATAYTRGGAVPDIEADATVSLEA